MKKRVFVSTVAFMAFFLAYSAPTFADDLAIGQDVANRPQDRNDYQALGLPVGGFQLFPKLETNEIYNSNLYATNSNAKSDFITTIAPEIALKSQFGTHELNFSAGGDEGLYSRYTAEDFMDYHFTTDGRIDVTRDTMLKAAASYSFLHEDRGAPESVLDDKGPTTYSLASFDVGGTHKFNRLSLGLDGQYSMYDYYDVQRLDGTTDDKGGRNRDETKLTTRVGYEIQESFEAYLRGTVNDRNYLRGNDGQFGVGGVDRDSNGYEIAAGTRLDLTGVLTGDVYAGYMQQDYSNAALDTISGTLAGGSLAWNPTQLTTVKASLSRSVEETIYSDYTGYIDTLASLGVEHELRRNILLQAGLHVNNLDYIKNSTFVAGSSVLNETYYGGDVGARYLMNRYLYVGGNYGYEYLNSNQSASNTNTQKVTLKLGVQY